MLASGPLLGIVLGLALPTGKRRAWLLPLLPAFLLLALSNLDLVARFLHSARIERLAQSWLTPPLALAGGIAAAVFFLWSLYLLVVPDDADLRLASRLARNGDHRGAAGLYLKAGKTRKALAEFQKARAWVDAAKVARDLGRTEAAAGFFRKAGGEFLSEAAHLYTQAGNGSSARACFEALATWYMDRGRLGDAVATWMRAGEPARAARTARLALEKGHMNPSTGEFVAARRAAETVRDHELMARLEESEGRYEEAAAAWRAAGKPGRAAENLIRLGRFEAAAEVLESSGHSREATRLLYRAERRLAERLDRASGAHTRIVRGELEGLAAKLLPLLEKEGMDDERLEVLLHLERVDEAVGLLLAHDRVAEAADVASRNERWDLAGSLLERLGRWGEAGDMYELAGKLRDAARCAERATEYERAFHLYERSGDTVSAAGCMARAGSVQKALRILCDANHRLDAWELLKTHPGPVPDIPDVILQVAGELKEAGRTEEAITCLQRTVVGVALTPGRTAAAVELARYLFEVGDLDAAEIHVNRVLEIDYSDAEARKLAEGIRRAREKRAILEATPAPGSSTSTEAVVERYEIITELGRGGMGVVFKARDTRLERVVAIKVVRTSSADEAAQLEREAKAAATLNHPAIVTVFDFEPGLGGYLISMEYVDGEGLDRLLRQAPERISSNLLPILVQIADGIAYAHAHRVVHRDIKPGNILLTPANRVKIFDFGIAARLDTDGDSTSRICGTPFYMSPEQIRGCEPNPASDIYSLGATFFHLATGRPPFPRGNVIDAHLTKSPPDPAELNPGLPRELSDIILHCLEKEPAARFSSAEELHRALVRTAMRS
ncbi:MAG: protein kinase [Acidobacteria bacterium]|nr:protein kinase [Acidobacteriota bacterium]